MNARKIFKDCVILNAEEAEEFVKKEYRKLRAVIFSIMPDECFLRMWNVLDLQMVFMLNLEMIEKRRVRQKDICALCSAEDCPFNNVSHKNPRVIKVKLIGNLYNQ